MSENLKEVDVSPAKNLELVLGDWGAWLKNVKMGRVLKVSDNGADQHWFVASAIKRGDNKEYVVFLMDKKTAQPVEPKQQIKLVISPDSLVDISSVQAAVRVADGGLSSTGALLPDDKERYRRIFSDPGVTVGSL